jgi:hypothetical protein
MRERGSMPAAASRHERAFAFLHVNERLAKPRRVGITEIRGPYYTPVGPRYLQDVLETIGEHVDALKFAGGAFALMPRDAVSQLIEICHAHQVHVSTGGFVEYVLGQVPQRSTGIWAKRRISASTSSRRRAALSRSRPTICFVSWRESGPSASEPNLRSGFSSAPAVRRTGPISPPKALAIPTGWGPQNLWRRVRTFKDG